MEYPDESAVILGDSKTLGNLSRNETKSDSG